jgi:transcriptional regulator with XRE-family HTH domain
MRVGKKSIFTQRFNEAMKKRGMRNADIVEASRLYGGELSSASVAQYRTGLYIPKKEKLALIASILGVSENWLMGIDNAIEDSNLSSDENLLLINYRKLNKEKKLVIQSLIKTLIS